MRAPLGLEVSNPFPPIALPCLGFGSLSAAPVYELASVRGSAPQVVPTTLGKPVDTRIQLFLDALGLPVPLLCQLLQPILLMSLAYAPHPCAVLKPGLVRRVLCAASLITPLMTLILPLPVDTSDRPET